MPDSAKKFNMPMCASTKESFETWHLVKGQWTHIIQLAQEDGTVHYYTDGVREVPKALESSTADSPFQP
jgi:hypothetical protein